MTTSKLTGANRTSGPNLSHFFSKLNNNNNNNNYKCNTSSCHYDKDVINTTTTTTVVASNNNINKTSNPSTSATTNSTTKCAGCRKVIKEKYLLKALDQLWHEDCLKCSCCDCRLGEVGSTLFTKANLLLCRRDYLRLFGTTGYCCACSKMIPAFEMVMKAKNNVYHLECFACQQCNHRFCVGDRYFLCENKILCEYDYEERLLLAKASFEYAAYNFPQNNSPYLNNNFNNQYPNNDFGFQNPPPFFNHSPTLPSRTNGPPYTTFPPCNIPNPNNPPQTRLNNSDDISSGYGSPSPASS